jgi:hypothetical protein
MNDVQVAIAKVQQAIDDQLALLAVDVEPLRQMQHARVITELVTAWRILATMQEPEAEPTNG